MKKKFDLRNVFLSIVSFLLVSCTLSCSFLFLDNIKHAEPSPGSLTVQITGASLPGEKSSSARTLVPSLASSAKSYVITCTQGGSEVASETLNTIASYTFNNLKPGTVTVTVNAYNHATAREAGNLIATGSKDVILTAGSAANADVQLAYSTTGGTTGSINYTIQWPAASAESFKWKIDGSPYSAAITGLESGANLIGIMSAPSVTSGPHSLIIQFYKDSEIAGYAYEMVNVYANLESNSVVGADGTLSTTRVFTAAEMASSGTDVSAIIVAGGEASFIQFESDGSGSFNTSTVDTITVIPMVGESGQTISYTWKKGEADATPAASITAGTPLSLTLATGTTEVARTNTLTLTVTAPNTSTEKIYIITIRSPIYVTTPAQLTDAFAVLTNNVVLTASIDLSTGGAWTPVGAGDETATDPTTMFQGSFNGNGHTITGLTVTTTTSGDAGLFARVAFPARISNVRLVNVNITGGSGGVNNDGVGGLVGENYGGIITRCSVSGTVTGNQRVGGLVGNNRAALSGSSLGKITECYSTATVTASVKFCGGLVGSNWGDIENCYARSPVALVGAGVTSIAGLVGTLETSGSVVNCYASGVVYNSSVKYGLCGEPVGEYGSCTSSYYNQPLSGCSDTGKGLARTSDELKTQSKFAGWNFGGIWAMEPDKNSGYPYLQAIPPAVITIIETSMTATAFQTLIVRDRSADYKLSNNLTITGPHTPIGSAEFPFTGTFDGDGKSIINLTVTDANDSGLFHTVGAGGVVKNLHLENVSMPGTANDKGGIAAQNKGTIYRCSSSGTLSGAIRIGGLVGQNFGIIQECWSNASVTGTYNSGGLVGANGNDDKNNGRPLSSGHIVDCYSRGTVKVKDGGGLLGVNTEFGTVKNSYAAGSVVQDGPPVATACIQVLIGRSHEAAFLKIINCYFDESKIDKPLADNNPIALSACFGSHKNGIEMRTQSTFSDWDFSATTGVWAITRGINGGYPYLQHVAATEDTSITSLEGITNLAGDYILNAPVALSGNFTPLGTFIGSFDGNGKTITNMKIDISTALSPPLGMFETIAKAGFVRGVHFEDSDVLTRSRDIVGTLAGQNDGTVYECTSRGSVVGGDKTGGLIGLNNGVIQACSARGKVQGNNDVGGLVGRNTGTIEESFAFSGVFGYQSVGGLVGTCESDSDPAILNSYSRGVVSSPGIVGGFVGQASKGTIQNCYSATGVSLINSDPYMSNKNAGAFVGHALDYYFTNCYYDTGRCGLNSNGESINPIAGITSTVTISMTGPVWSPGTAKNGGYPYLLALTPVDDIIITAGNKTAAELAVALTAGGRSADYYLAGDVTITDSAEESFNTVYTKISLPFNGSFDGGGHTIKNISGGTRTQNVGMLFRYLGGAALVQNVVLENAISNSLNSQRAGLLCSTNRGTLYRCATSGAITNIATETGGLIGLNQGIVVECYSTAAVKDLGWTGGLIGLESGGTIINSYARGSVTSTGVATHSDVGGLVGNSEKITIINSYSTGLVTSVEAGAIGGFIADDNAVTNCFYDSETSGQSDENGRVNKKSTADMKNFTIFQSGDWDIVSTVTTANVWGIEDSTINNGYPYLQWAGDKTMVPSVAIPSGTMTASELKTIINADLSANYTLTGDITLSEPWTPLGSDTIPFTGTFDGGGNTISGITIADGTKNSGMFSKVGTGGIVKNLNVTAVSITGTSGDNNKYKGSIAAFNEGSIYRCSASGTVEGYTGIGGLVGVNTGTIRECWSFMTVTAGYLSGGLVGYNGNEGTEFDTYPNLIVDCYARGTVTVADGAGLVGTNGPHGTIQTSYVACSVVNSNQALAGGTGGAVEKCYFDSGVCSTSNFGTPTSTTNMKKLETFSIHWNIVGLEDSDYVWGIDEGFSYPYLQWAPKALQTP